MDKSVQEALLNSPLINMTRLPAIPTRKARGLMNTAMKKKMGSSGIPTLFPEVGPEKVDEQAVDGIVQKHAEYVWRGIRGEAKPSTNRKHKLFLKTVALVPV